MQLSRINIAEGKKNFIAIFDCSGDAATVGTRWSRCLAAFELYADSKGLILDSGKPHIDQQRRAQRFQFTGPDVQDIFSTLENTGTATDYKLAVDELNTLCASRQVGLRPRKFRASCQETGETIQQFFTRLKRLAKDCSFGADKENQIRDEILEKYSSDYKAEASGRGGCTRTHVP